MRKITQNALFSADIFIYIYDIDLLFVSCYAYKINYCIILLTVHFVNLMQM